MDCNAARALLPLATHAPDAPSGPEAAALRDHLATCSECDALFRAEARLDAHLGRAMLDVPIPSTLKQQILSRLEAERLAQWRERLWNSMRGLASAAAVLFAVGALWWWLSLPRSYFDGQDSQIAFNITRPTNQEAASSALHELGYANCGPPFVRYEHCISVGDGELPGYPGQRAPRLVFVGQREHAIVIGVDTRRYKVQPAEFAENGYKYRGEVWHTGGDRWAYLILYTGDNWNWLYTPPED
ncbi:MAG: hypothetical protein SNJ82_13250 [Gemmataceae bacterium]